MVFSAREVQLSWWVTGLELDQIHTTSAFVWSSEHLRLQWRWDSLQETTWGGSRRSGVIWKFERKVPLPLLLPAFIKYPQGPGPVVLQTYFKGLEDIFQVKSHAVPDTQNRSVGPKPCFSLSHHKLMWLLLRFASCHILSVGTGADAEASAALLSEPTKPFSCYRCAHSAVQDSFCHPRFPGDSTC